MIDILIVWTETLIGNNSNRIIEPFRKKFFTSITAKAERRIADNAFLYKELSIFAVLFIICAIARTMYLENFDKILQTLINGFS